MTVPLARFAAQHIGKLGTPFKRYHVAPVWRGENTQAGRYREFVQCDFDTIGTESVVADIETALVIYELFCEIGIDRFHIRINNRQVLNGFLAKLDLQQHSTAVLRALDKLEKIGPDKVADELRQGAGLSDSQIEGFLKLAKVQGTIDEVLSGIESIVQGQELGEAGVNRLREIAKSMKSAGVPETHYRIDLSIARGLDYYTGVVFETTLDELPSIGSVCSGGSTTIWRAFTPSSICQGSEPRWDWIGYWLLWKPWAIADCKNHGRRLHSALRCFEVERLYRVGDCDSADGMERRTLSGSQEVRSAVEVCGPKRVPDCGDRRKRRIGSWNLSGKESCR